MTQPQTDVMGCVAAPLGCLNRPRTRAIYAPQTHGVQGDLPALLLLHRQAGGKGPQGMIARDVHPQRVGGVDPVKTGHTFFKPINLIAAHG